MQHLAQHAFGATPQTIRTARDFATRTLDAWGGCRRSDDIRACVSELAGNAVQHASPGNGAYLLRLIRHPHCLHVEVHDSARRFHPRLPHASPTRESGRGLRIIHELGDDWGVRPLTSKKKAVWICFRRPEATTSRCSCTP